MHVESTLGGEERIVAAYEFMHRNYQALVRRKGKEPGTCGCKLVVGALQGSHSSEA